MMMVMIAGDRCGGRGQEGHRRVGCDETHG